MSGDKKDYKAKVEELIARDGIDPSKKITALNMGLEGGRISEDEYDSYVNRINQPPLENVVAPAQPGVPPQAPMAPGPAPGPATPAPPPADIQAPGIAGAEFDKPLIPSTPIPFSPMGAAGPVFATNVPGVYKHKEPELTDAEAFYSNMGDYASLDDIDDKGEEAVAFKKYKDSLWKYATKKATEMQTPAIRVSNVSDDELASIGMTRGDLSEFEVSPMAQAAGAAIDDMSTWGMVQQAMGTMNVHPVQKHLEMEGFIPAATEKIERNVADNPWTYGLTSVGAGLGSAALAAGTLFGGPAVAAGAVGTALGGLSMATMKHLAKWSPKALKRILGPGGSSANMAQRIGGNIVSGLPAGAAIEAGQQGVREVGRLARGQEFDRMQFGQEMAMRGAALGASELGGALAADWIMRPLGRFGREFFTNGTHLEEALRTFQALDSHAMRKSPVYKKAVKKARLVRKGDGIIRPGARVDHIQLKDTPEIVIDSIRKKEDEVYKGLSKHNEELMKGLEDVKVDPRPLKEHLERAIRDMHQQDEAVSMEQLVKDIGGTGQEDLGDNIVPFVDDRILIETWRRLHKITTHKPVTFTSHFDKKKVTIKPPPIARERMMSAKNIVRMVEGLDHKLHESAAAAGDKVNPIFKGMQEAVRDVRDQLGPEYSQAMEDHSVMLAALGNLKNELGILGKRLRKTGEKTYHNQLLESVENRLLMPEKGGSMPSPTKKYGAGMSDEFTKLRRESPVLEQSLRKAQESMAVRQKTEAIKKSGVGFWHTMLSKLPAVADPVFYGMQYLGDSPLLPILGLQQFGPYTNMRTARPIPAPGDRGYKGPGAGVEQNIKEMASIPDEEKDAQMKVMKIIQESR